MKELEGLFDWLNSFNRPEQGCESLIEWLELEQKAAWHRGGNIARHLFVGVFFTIASLLTALYVTFVAGVPINHPNPTPFAVAMGLLIAIGGTSFGWLAGRAIGRSRPTFLKTGRDADALRTIGHLRNVTGYRGLRRELGEHGVIELNEGANLYLRCRSSLTSEAWTSQSSDDPWLEARDGMLRAMEAAMERLTVYVVRKRTFAEIAPVLEEMRVATNEAVRITEQRSSLAGSAGRDIRSSLARMRELAAAEDELLRQHDAG